MRVLQALVLGLVVSAFLSACVIKPQVDGHGDGEMVVPVSIRVVDQRGGKAISSATITFFSSEECRTAELISVEREAGRAPSFPDPKGSSVLTGDDGTAILRCRFQAAFLWSYASGARQEIGTDVYSTGRFTFQKEGYATVTVDARELLPKVPYRPTDFREHIRVKMTKQPNQALQTTSVTRSGFGKVPVCDRQRRGV
jgi:hypothetical protein